MKKILYITAFCFITDWVTAQSASQCSDALIAAEQAFEQGRLLFLADESGGNKLFFDCLANKNYDKDEEIRARKLLVKVYLFTDNEKKAEDNLIGLLIADKEHRLSPEDPAELHFLYSQFNTEPIVRVSFKVGVNKTFITTLQPFNTFQSGNKKYNQEGDETGLGIGFWGELLLEKHLAKGIEVLAGAQLRLATYQVEGEIIETNLTYQVTNQNTMLRIPFLVRYNFGYYAKNEEKNRKKLVPYIFLGGAFDYTLNAKYVNTSRSGGTSYTLLDESSSLTDRGQISRTNISIIGGAGLRLRVGRGKSKVNFLSFELRYDNALFNYIIPEKRWENQDVQFGIGHVEDDLTLNALSASIGFTRSFYIPSKRKQYR